MISDSELLRYCSVPVLNRGRSIAFSRVERMSELSCERTGSITRLSACVQDGPAGEVPLHTDVSLDERAGTLRSARCTCPASGQAGGVCKHVAALVLRYNRTPGQFAGYQQRRFDGTSLVLANFMRRSEARRLDRQGARPGTLPGTGDGGQQEPSAGSVRLELTLEPSHRGWKARFKIAGPRASYVLKDIAAFVENMRDGAYCSYGKRLAFTHTIVVLDDLSRRVYEFLTRAYAVRSLTSLESCPGSWDALAGGSRESAVSDEPRPLGAGARGGLRSSERDLVLSDEEAVELVELYRDAGFMLSIKTPAGHLDVPGRILDANPPLDLDVERYDDGGCSGYLIRRGAGALRFLCGKGSTYALEGSALYRCTPEFAACRELLEAIYDAPDAELFVDDADRALFCRTILPLLDGAVPARMPADLEALRPVPCRMEFYLDRTVEGVTCDPVAVYGSHRFPLLGAAAHEGAAAFAGSGGVSPTALDGAPKAAGKDGSDASAGLLSPNEKDLVRDEAAEQAAERVVSSYFVVDERAVGSSNLFVDVCEQGRRNTGSLDGRPLVRGSLSTGLSSGTAGRAVPLGAIMGPYVPSKDVQATERFLAEGLPTLRAAGTVYATPAFDGLMAPRPPKVRIGLSVRSGLVELSLMADEVPAREVAAVLASYRRKKRFHRLKDGTYLDLQGAGLAELDGIASSLGLTASQLDTGCVELPGYHAFHLDTEVAGAEKDASFTDYLDDFRSVDPASYVVPPTLVGVLRPYQVEGYRWLRAVGDRGFGGILADEMGLGKTVQLIAYLLATRDEARCVGPSLIVCPASLVYNWQAELERFAPDMRVGVVAGSPSERAAVLRGAHWVESGACDDGYLTDRISPDSVIGASRAPASRSGVDGASDDMLVGSDYEVLITSYDLLRRDVALYEGRTLFCQVLDEAQYIKNHATKVAQAVKQLAASHRFALTGTPIENRLSELWSIFDYLMPGILGPYQRFQKRFEQPILDGDEGAAAQLQAFVAPFVLRRLKRDVLTDLPDKIDGVVYVQLEGEQRRLYAAHEQRLRAQLARTGDAEFATGKLQILAELTHLRELCCDPRLLYEDAPDASAKLAAIVDLVETCRDEGTKMLVFSQFTSFLDLIAQRLRAEGVAFYTITGSTPKQHRLELVNAFNSDDTPVFLISLKAGNTGLNLTGASVVVHADPWWNAAAQSQATDRAHRIGQTHVVSVYQVVARDTIEERILRLQKAKSALAEQFVGAAGGEAASGIARLTKDDLLAILG
ncbi:MAG: SNF2 helicase associated domain-containing protein [Coriobacteriia bacterium]|nr:SNF2 helicase associated domain-containing protein [Coriobacteriia bacterium]